MQQLGSENVDSSKIRECFQQLASCRDLETVAMGLSVESGKRGIGARGLGAIFKLLIQAVCLGG